MPSLVARTFVGFVAALAIASCGGDDGSAPSAGGSTAGAEPDGQAAVRVVASGLQVPWGVAFLPGGDALVSERTTARILRVPARGGAAQEVMRVPGVDTNAGEGGLLGLAVSPEYARDGLVYA